MDNKNAIAASIGIGAIGSVLAYYGYNKLTNSSQVKNSEMNFVKGGDGIGTTEVQKTNVMDNIKERVTKAIQETLKNDPTLEASEKVSDSSEKVSDSSKEKSDKWKSFWKGEYNADSQEKCIE